MSSNIKNYQLSDDLQGLFCKPSLMRGEDPAVYAKLLAQVAEVVQPRDVLDQMMVSDITNHFWEQQRMRRCSGIVINAARRAALTEILEQIVCSQRVYGLVNAFFGIRSKPAEPTFFVPVLPDYVPPKVPPMTKQEVITLLQKHGLDETAIDTIAIEKSLETLAVLESLILKHEIRRDAILREVEHRREKRPAPTPRKVTAQPNSGSLPAGEAPSLIALSS